MKAIATTTWNCADLIGSFLQHHRSIGFDVVYVMDFDSKDETAEILNSPDYDGFVRHVPFPGIGSLDSSAIILKIMKEELDEDAWCLYCDPDEFLALTPIEELAPQHQSSEDALLIPRYNMTGLRSVAQNEQDRVCYLSSLNLRIEKRYLRKLPDDLHSDVLTPPWIHTAIPGKVFVRVHGTESIGDGDHGANVRTATRQLTNDQAYLMHFPFRTFSSFEDKIKRAAIDFSVNTSLGELYGWQLRRWIRLAGQGHLFEEYLQQFIADDEVDQLIEQGDIVIDDAVLSLKY